MNIYELRRHYSIHSDDQSNIICKLINLLETKDDEIEFWMSEGDSRLCEEDVEWRKLSAISHEDRTDAQNNRVRDLATIIREKHDEGLLWAEIDQLKTKVAVFESVLKDIDDLRNTSQMMGRLSSVNQGMTIAANKAREALTES